MTGPLARSWLLQVKAQALTGKGDLTAARRALEEALRVARAIGTDRLRESNLERITRMIAGLK